jgi:hypothetical protein
VSDINDKFAGLNSVRDLAGTSGLATSAIDALKGASGLNESIRLAAAIGMNSDPFAGLNPVRDLAGVSGLTTSATDTLKGARGLDESMGLADAAARINSVTDPFAGRNSAQVLAAASGSVTSAIDALKGARSFDESVRFAGGALDTGSALGKLARQISDQQSAIAALRPLVPEMPERFVLPELMRAPELRLPPNPLHETNRRLASIEQRFDRMESIALSGAEIATGLQASAAIFLTKFEKASADNDRTSSRAIWLGIIAVLIAVTMPVAQILYTELWRAPADSTSQQAAITDMKRQIKGLEDTQRTAADELAKVLSSGNTEMTSALRDIRNLLIEQQKRPPIVPSEAKP